MRLRRHVSTHDEQVEPEARRRSAAGQSLVIFALFGLVLIGSLALSVDAGYLMTERRGVQGAADAAALAATKSLQRHENAQLNASGMSYAASNGYANGGGNTVSISSPPASGSRAGSDVCVQVTITHNVQQFFVGAIYSGPWQAGATATACTEPTHRPYALVALDPNGDGLTAGGSASLQILDGGALSNADVDLCGTSSWIQAEGPLDAVAGIVVCPGADADALSMNSKAASLTDPLAGVPEPDCSTLAVKADPNIQNSTPSPINLTPGNYTNGITIHGNDKVINFAGGVYCFGDDLSVNAGSSGNTLTSNGSAVLFYYYGTAMFDIDGGGNNVILDSGTSGACNVAACAANIVIFYSRSDCQDLWLVGGNNTNVAGIIYAPCSLIHLGGAAGSLVTGQIFGADITIVGGSELAIQYDQYVDTKVPLVYLVE